MHSKTGGGGQTRPSDSAQWDVSPIFWPKMAKIKVKVRNV